MSTVQVTSIESKTANTPPIIKDSNGVQIGTLCRAWVNFNGTGTVAIRAAFNVVGITDNGTGTYTVTMAIALPDGNYCCVTHAVQSDEGQSGVYLDGVFAYNRTTTTFRIDTLNDSGTTAARTDMAIIDVAVFE